MRPVRIRHDAMLLRNVQTGTRIGNALVSEDRSLRGSSEATYRCSATRATVLLLLRVPKRRPDVTTAGAPPGICAASAEVARLDRMRRHGNALQASARLRRSTSIRIWRRIPATDRATN